MELGFAYFWAGKWDLGYWDWEWQHTNGASFLPQRWCDLPRKGPLICSRMTRQGKPIYHYKDNCIVGHFTV
jgi:hypothetical protein